MTKVSRIRLSNFQRHAELEINLPELITTLVGPSGSGKSSFIRALVWAITNEPSGRSFIKHGTKTAKVEVEFEGGLLIRTAGKENSYELNGTEYKAFGRNVPEPIAAALNVSDVNIQRQHDAPFWLGSSPAAVAREINKVVNLDDIDRILKACNQKTRKASTELSYVTEQLDLAKKKRSESAWAVDCLEKWKAIEGLRHIHAEKLSDIKRLSQLYEDAKGIRQRKKTLENSLQELKRYQESYTAASQAYEDVEKKVRRLHRLERQLELCQQERKDAACELQKLQKKVTDLKVCDACGQIITQP